MIVAGSPPKQLASSTRSLSAAPAHVMSARGDHTSCLPSPCHGDTGAGSKRQDADADGCSAVAAPFVNATAASSKAAGLDCDDSQMRKQAASNGSAQDASVADAFVDGVGLMRGGKDGEEVQSFPKRIKSSLQDSADSAVADAPALHGQVSRSSVVDTPATMAAPEELVFVNATVTATATAAAATTASISSQHDQSHRPDGDGANVGPCVSAIAAATATATMSLAASASGPGAGSVGAGLATAVSASGVQASSAIAVGIPAADIPLFHASGAAGWVRMNVAIISEAVLAVVIETAIIFPAFTTATGPTKPKSGMQFTIKSEETATEAAEAAEVAEAAEAVLPILTYSAVVRDVGCAGTPVITGTDAHALIAAEEVSVSLPVAAMVASTEASPTVMAVSASVNVDGAHGAAKAETPAVASPGRHNVTNVSMWATASLDQNQPPKPNRYKRYFIPVRINDQTTMRRNLLARVTHQKLLSRAPNSGDAVATAKSNAGVNDTAPMAGTHKLLTSADSESAPPYNPALQPLHRKVGQNRAPCTVNGGGNSGGGGTEATISPGIFSKGLTFANTRIFNRLAARGQIVAGAVRQAAAGNPNYRRAFVKATVVGTLSGETQPPPSLDTKPYSRPHEEKQQPTLVLADSGSAAASASTQVSAVTSEPHGLAIQRYQTQLKENAKALSQQKLKQEDLQSQPQSWKSSPQQKVASPGSPASLAVKNEDTSPAVAVTVAADAAETPAAMPVTTTHSHKKKPVPAAPAATGSNPIKTPMTKGRVAHTPTELTKPQHNLQTLSSSHSRALEGATTPLSPPIAAQGNVQTPSVQLPYAV
jgi:hypothetical protein